MTNPQEYKATDPEVTALMDQVKRDHQDKQDETRRRVAEFQNSGKESVE